MNLYWTTFLELIETPFEHTSLVWGIVPLYFALRLNELTSTKANYRTAIQTGFSFLWAAVQWLYPYFIPHGAHGPHFALNAMLPVNLLVTFLAWDSARSRSSAVCAANIPGIATSSATHALPTTS